MASASCWPGSREAVRCRVAGAGWRVAVARGAWECEAVARGHVKQLVAEQRVARRALREARGECELRLRVSEEVQLVAEQRVARRALREARGECELRLRVSRCSSLPSSEWRGKRY